MRAKLRRVLVAAHRWAGIALALPLMIAAITGAALVVARDIDRRLEPALFRVAPAERLHPLDAIHTALQARFGQDSDFIYRLPRDPQESLTVYVRGPWEGQVYVDPGSGRWLGERGEHDGWFNLLFELHSTLLAGDAGRALLAAVALGAVLLLLSGAWLWWPTRRHALRIRRRAGRAALLFDLHRVSGLLLAVLVGVVVVTGAYMAWRPLSQGVSAVAGASPVRPPAVTPLPGAARAGPDLLLHNARAALPGGQVSFIQWPARPLTAVRVRMRLADEPHPNGISSVWLHPQTGEVLRVLGWREFDAGARAYQWIYPLHSGVLLGAANKLLLALAALALMFFVGSGLWLWLLRRPATINASASVSPDTFDAPSRPGLRRTKEAR